MEECANYTIEQLQSLFNKTVSEKKDSDDFYDHLKDFAMMLKVKIEIEYNSALGFACCNKAN